MENTQPKSIENTFENLQKEFDAIKNLERKIQESVLNVEKLLTNENNHEIEKIKNQLLPQTIGALQDISITTNKLQRIYNTFKTPEARRLEELNKVFSLNKYVFFLGGMDAEMLGIKNILENQNLAYRSKDLSWGAKASDYDSEILKCVTEGKTPVLIELEGAQNIPNSINIDHHGELSKNDPSIVQAIFGIIHRKEVLLGINDAEYIGGLIKKGVTEEEINALREIDRISQGITEAEENEGVEAIKNMKRFDDLDDLIIVTMNHSKIATVSDRLFSEQYNKKGQNLLVLSKEKSEINYTVDNKKELIGLLEKKFGGFSGGKEINGYWGVNKEIRSDMPDQEIIVEFIKNYLSNNN
jgi:hypothetical protein